MGGGILYVTPTGVWGSGEVEWAGGPPTSSTHRPATPLHTIPSLSMQPSAPGTPQTIAQGGSKLVLCRQDIFTGAPQPCPKPSNAHTLNSVPQTCESCRAGSCPGTPHRDPVYIRAPWFSNCHQQKSEPCQMEHRGEVELHQQLTCTAGEEVCLST